MFSHTVPAMRALTTFLSLLLVAVASTKTSVDPVFDHMLFETCDNEAIDNQATIITSLNMTPYPISFDDGPYSLDFSLNL